jgi:hypothetical protein
MITLHCDCQSASVVIIILHDAQSSQATYIDSCRNFPPLACPELT